MVIGTVTAAPYTMNLTHVAAGNYNVSAKATGQLGGSATSAIVDLTVQSNAAPPISLSAEASTTKAPATVNLKASVADGNGAIAKVEFYNGGTLLASLPQAPYEYAWNGVEKGTYTLTARAFYDGGATATSNVATLVIAASDAPDDAEVFYIHTDQINTAREIVSEAGETVWRADQDPFGANLPNESPGGKAPFVYNLRFPGQYFDKETWLHYNFFRDYDPQTGRYIQSDPIGLGGGINTYAYVGSNPLTYTDPYGLWAWGDPAPSWMIDGVAGFGDTLSFGATRVVRRWMGTDGAVNRCSSAYRNGEWAALGLSMAFGAAHLGRNAVNQMGRAGDLGTRVERGIGRLFSDGRTWGSVRDTWSRAAGNGQRSLAANGQSLHHWLIPQRFGEVNAGFNYMPTSAGFNSWMNGTTPLRTAVEWGFRSSVLGIYGAPLTAAFSGEDCGC